MPLPTAKTRAEAAQQFSQILRQVIPAFRARMDEELKPHHCTLAQVRVLHVLQQNPGASFASIARACAVTPQSAQALLARVVERGWATRGKDSYNERLVTAQLTRAGERILSVTQQIKARIEAEVWAGVPLADLRQMNATLARALSNLDHPQAR